MHSPFRSSAALCGLLLLALAFFNGCSQTEKPSIVGTWNLQSVENDGEEMPLPEGLKSSLTFNEDGSLEAKSSFQNRVQPREGTWKWLEEGKKLHYVVYNSGVDTLDTEVTVEELTSSRLVLNNPDRKEKAVFSR